MLRCSNLAKFAQPGDAVPEQQASLGQEALLARTHSVSLRTRLVLGAALLGAAALLTAGLLVLGLGNVSDRLGAALAAEKRVERHAALSSQAASFLVVATEAVQSEPDAAARLARMDPAVRALEDTFVRLRRDLEQAVGEQAALGLDAQSRRATQSLGLARMEALLRSTLDGLAADGPRERLQASLDRFASGFDMLLNEAVSDELRARAMVLRGIDEMRARLTLWAGLIALAVLALLGLFVFGLVRPQLRRLDLLMGAARQIGRGDFALALPEGPRDEIGTLFTETRRMAGALAERSATVEAEWARLNETIAARTAELREANARLARIDGDRRRFFADISHELRTPLTVILMEAQLGRAGTPEPQAAFATIEARALRLNRRIDDLLRVARSESGQLALDRAPFDLGQAVTEALEETQAELRAAEMAVHLPPLPQVQVLGDRNWARQVIAGLIRNAIRHARSGGHLALRLSPEGEVAVIDNGPGIPPDRQAGLFDRFAQGDGPARGEGFGIGLALTAWVMQAQGGQVSLQSPVPRAEALGQAPGTKLCVALPRAAG
jgi:signal transduction histidine kinase